MNIIDAIKDEHLFQPFLGDLESWKGWLTLLRAVYGLPIRSRFARNLIQQCTGRELPPSGFDTALLLTGRRSGKSRTAAVIGAFEAVLAGHEAKLSPGERGIVPIICPSKYQGRIVKGYLRAIFKTPLLANEVEDEQREGFTLRNGNRIEILAGDFRTVRGYTLLAAIVDEAAFFGYDSDTKVKSDTELIRAIKPSLATVGGKLIAITSPYARMGWCWEQYKKHFGNEASKVLIWNCPSRTMNPKLPQRVVDEAMAEDLAGAKSEYMGEFRDDVGLFLPREVVERLVVKDRLELLPHEKTHYSAFCDVSGGRGDDATLAIAYREGRKVILSLIKRWRPPFNPYQVIGSMAEELRRYRIRRIIGDNYSAEFVASAFLASGIQYVKCDVPKSGLYLELLPRLCSGEIELLDNEVLVDQLAKLERRTRSGGKDIIDHPPGGHDDIANAVAGIAVLAGVRKKTAGVW